MWKSFEAIKNALVMLSKMDCVNVLTKTKPFSALHNKVLEFDLIFAIMFMRLTMKMTKLILAIEMQMEGLNILNVLISKGAVSSFERIRGRQSEMNDQINARV